MVVVLPAPLGPSSPRTSPSSISKLTSEMTSVGPNRRLTPMTRTPAVTGAGASGPVVGGFGAHPLGAVDARRDRRLGHKRLGRVLPVDDREAVVLGHARGVDGLVVVRAGEAVDGVAVEVVEPGHEAFSREVGAHGLGGVLELQAHGPAFRRPLVQLPPGLVLGEVVEELGDDRVALVAVGRAQALGVYRVATWRAEVGTHGLAPRLDGRHL